MRRLVTLKLLFFIYQLSLAQAPVQPGILWKFQTGGAIRSGLISDSQNVYFGNSAGQFFCVNTLGENVWEIKLEGAIVSSPALNENTIFVSCRDKALYAINKHDGNILWQFDFSEPQYQRIGGWKYFGAGPLILDDKVLAGSGNGTLYAMDISDGSLHWTYDTAGPIRATPISDGTYIYQPSNDGFIHVLDTEGILIWKFKTDGADLDQSNQGQVKKGIYNQPSLMNELLVFGSRDGNTYAVDIETRKEKWRFTYGPTWAMSNSIDDGIVYVGWSTNNKITALDLESGEMLWDKALGAHNYTKALPFDESVVVGSADGKLHSLSKATGSDQWVVEVGSEIYTSPIKVKDLIIFGADDGALYAVRKLPVPKRAVYLPNEIIGNAQYLVVDQKVAPYLVERGFEQLDAEALHQFIEERLEDQHPSVVVFALPLIPEQIIGQNPTRGLMRRYLDNGGKVIWFGDLPNYYELDSNDQFKRDPSAGIALLEVDFQNVNESGNYFSRATQEGRNWGLPVWFKTTAAIVAPQADIIPLAFDEFGRISAWVRSYHSRSGAGFVSCRTWGWNLPIKEQDLEIIYQLATYGLE